MIITNIYIKKAASQKGIALIAVLSILVVASVYLSSYIMWTIWDQRNLIRQQGAEEADKLARAGLNRAILDLYQDADSWLDGEINGVTVISPSSSNPDRFNNLYSENLENGSYTVQIDYLQNPKSCTSGCSFFEKRMWVRSTGTFTSSTGVSVSRRLEQIVNYYTVKNLTQNTFYTKLQDAVNAANSNDNIGIAAVTLDEIVVINAARNFNIKGGYDPDFGYRSCSAYPTIINGDLTISGSANVNLSGVTIE